MKNQYSNNSKWYLTYDGINTCSTLIQTQNSTSWCYTNDKNLLQINFDNSYYCYSFDGLLCYSDFGVNCSQSDMNQCASFDKVNPQNVTYCITNDSRTCFRDQGQLCNLDVNSNQRNNCQFGSNMSYCASIDGNKCYSFQNGWYFTIDGS